MSSLRDVCVVFRSRNAGAFRVTYDFVFESPPLFDRAMSSGVLDADAAAAVLGVAADDLLVTNYPQGCAIKITAPRRHSGGAPDDHDVDGAQQFVSFLGVQLPDE